MYSAGHGGGGWGRGRPWGGGPFWGAAPIEVIPPMPMPAVEYVGGEEIVGWAPAPPGFQPPMHQPPMHQWGHGHDHWDRDHHHRWGTGYMPDYEMSGYGAGYVPGYEMGFMPEYEMGFMPEYEMGCYGPDAGYGTGQGIIADAVRATEHRAWDDHAAHRGWDRGREHGRHHPFYGEERRPGQPLGIREGGYYGRQGGNYPPPPHGFHEGGYYGRPHEGGHFHPGQPLVRPNQTVVHLNELAQQGGPAAAAYASVAQQMMGR